jgi:hypothetical protein
MRVALVGIPAGDIESIQTHLKNLARGFEASGHMVDIIDHRSDTRISGYDFITILSEPLGFGAKLPARIAEYLANAGSIAGKRSMAVLRKKGFMSGKSLARLMAMLEAEGLVVTCGEIVSKPEESLAAARGAPVVRV